MNQNDHSGLTVDHRQYVCMTCITQNGSCNNNVKFGTLCMSACVRVCVFCIRTAITFPVMSEGYLSTSFYTGIDVSIISGCLFFF